MLVSQAKQKELELKKAHSGQYLLQHILGEHVLKNQRQHGGWDGYIHPSSLDWNKSPEAQVNSLRKTWQPSVDSLLRMEVGNLIHDKIQSVLIKDFFESHQTEEHLSDDKILFRGTPDQIGTHKTLGSFILEYKSVASYQRDKSNADRKIKKLGDLGELHDDVYNSLCIKYQDYKEPKSDHLTQLFTYIWILAYLKKEIPKHAGVVYIRKDNMNTMEFWYKVSENKDLIVKAKDNYQKVYNLVLKDPEAIKIREANKKKYGK